MFPRLYVRRSTRSAVRVSVRGATVARTEALESRQLLSLTVPSFSSLPTAPHKLFIDFDGAAAPADWAGATATPAFDQDGIATYFSENELDAIRSIWARVADRFKPFNVDVTTTDPGNRADRVTAAVIVGGMGEWYGDGSFGGVAMEGGFTSQWSSNTAFVFAGQSPFNLSWLGNTIAHEAGHLFGLDHQSNRDLPPGERDHDYSIGGTEPTSGNFVGPVMGNTNTAASGWWLGPTPDYLGNGANTLQNDVTGLAAVLGYRADDAGNTRTLAKQVGAINGIVDLNGVIETVADADWYTFNTRGGLATLYVNFDVLVPSMLSPTVELRDANGNLIATAEQVAQFGRIEANLPAGTYSIMVKGDGWLPVVGSNNGYTNSYADIGSYRITGGIEKSDPDDTIWEITSRADRMRNVGDNIDLELDNPMDVDLFGVTVQAGERIVFDVDSRAGSNINTYLRLFDFNGFELLANDNGTDTGESASGFSFIDYTFTTSGTYYVGMSLATNKTYDINNGEGDIDTTTPTGLYRLSIVDRTPASANVVKPTTVRVSATRGDVTLVDGRVFGSATGFIGGTERTSPFAVAGTEDDRLYSSMRYGTDFSFSRQLPNGNYTIYLHMTEPTQTTAGARLFDVFAEGAAVLTNYDVVARAGFATAHKVAVPVTIVDGQLNIQFQGKVSTAIISAIVIAPRYEAESTVRSGPLVLTQHTGFTGSGYTDFTTDSGQSIQFTVHASATGRAQLTFRYANGSTSNRPLALTVNGQTATTGLSFAPTGSWTTWREVTYDITLSQGVNTVRLASTGTSGANIDALMIA